MPRRGPLLDLLQESFSVGGGKLSPVCLERIARAPELCISAITAFEIAIKVRSGRLALPAKPAEWLRIVVAHHGIQIVPQSSDMHPSIEAR